jgi:hypothetical protein
MSSKPFKTSKLLCSTIAAKDGIERDRIRLAFGL